MVFCFSFNPKFFLQPEICNKLKETAKTAKVNLRYIIKTPLKIFVYLALLAVKSTLKIQIK